MTAIVLTSPIGGRLCVWHRDHVVRYERRVSPVGKVHRVAETFDYHANAVEKMTDVINSHFANGWRFIEPNKAELSLTEQASPYCMSAYNSGIGIVWPSQLTEKHIGALDLAYDVLVSFDEYLANELDTHLPVIEALRDSVFLEHGKVVADTSMVVINGKPFGFLNSVRMQDLMNLGSSNKAIRAIDAITEGVAHPVFKAGKQYRFIGAGLGIVDIYWRVFLAMYAQCADIEVQCNRQLVFDRYEVLDFSNKTQYEGFEWYDHWDVIVDAINACGVRPGVTNVKQLITSNISSEQLDLWV